MTELKYSDHFQCYELLLADIVELIPTDVQRAHLEELRHWKINNLRFASVEEIKGLGVIPGTTK